MQRDKKRVNILLVEDNEGDILLTMDAFDESKINTNFSVARNGKVALDILFKREDHSEAVSPDLILLDINMPIIDGHEVLKKIKQTSELKKIPVIMLTTSSNQKDINRAYQNYVNSYVTKPIEMEEFIMAISKIESFWLQLCEFSKQEG